MTDSTTRPAAVDGISVALAVSDLDEAVRHFRAAFGLAEPAYATSETDKVAVAIFNFGASQLQLVCATGEESLIAQHIARNGEGLHHFGFIVSDVDGMLGRLRDQGIRTLSEEGRPGAGDLRVGFVHPKAAYGTVVELIEIQQS
jgi:methylmalonyl-CoA/ethylmalonyl-CoA epimerase